MITLPRKRVNSLRDLGRRGPLLLFLLFVEAVLLVELILLT